MRGTRRHSARRESVEVTEYTYTAFFEPAEKGGYVVTIPALPGCVTEGDTIEEARAMARDSIVGYLESLQKDGEEIPVEQSPAITERLAVGISREEFLKLL
jgi:predicted RNase H-like HicB family nuclease